MKQTAEELIKRYRSGQVEALGKLVEEYRKPLFGFILSMTNGHDDAEEIFQDVWFRAIRALDTYKSKRFLSWLFKIAHNRIIDRRRRQRPEQSLQETHDHEENGRTTEDTLGSDREAPSRVSGNRELALRIQQAVAALPLDQREVFAMRTQSDLPFKEIARIQGTSINTALARMQYALAKLRETLREDYENL
jgi:RNA polymerase sigma-70 factor (ECF subfamily)